MIQQQNKILSLVGEPFIYRVSDCYTLMQKYYKIILNIDIDFNYYGKQQITKTNDFSKVDDLKMHDVLVFKNSGNGMHCGVYIGNNQVIHSVMNKGGTIIENLKTIPFKQLGTYRHETLL